MDKVLKRRRAVLTVLLLIALLAGCGSRKPEDAGPQPDPIPGDNVPEKEGSMNDRNVMLITVGSETLEVTLEQNASADALKELLKDGPVTADASNYGGFEKVCQLPEALPSSDNRIVTGAGDVMLYDDDKIVIFYGSNTWSYTRLGRIEGKTAAELEKILSGRESEVTFSLP